MSDIWNPFDTNNPVYVEVAKRTRRSRRQARGMVLTAIALGLAYYSGSKGFGPTFGIHGRPNQFGAVRRK